MSFDLRLSRRSLLPLAGLGLGSALLGACGNDRSGGGDGLSVVTSNYPMSYLVAGVGGDRVEITDLTTPGADAHGLELSVQQTLLVQEADLVIQIPGYQTALDDAIASGAGDNALDVTAAVEMISADGGEAHDHGEGEHEEHDHGPDDPHLWHDPLRMADIADAIAEALAAADPEGAEPFREGAATLREELEALDAELSGMFDAVDAERTFITSHAAYAYLAARYDLHQIGIAGVDPETEPSPQRLLELERLISDHGVTTIFFETTASPKVAQTLAENAGVRSEELDNLETQLDPEQDYPAVMRSNAEKLVESWS